MKSSEIRSRFLKFFEKRGHAIIPSASLVPENDPSVLFNTAGMQPLVPYLLGEKHPSGKRLVNIQKCVRTQDIDEVGDNTHDTFFEMLGNWSLGDYFKKDAIQWSYEFLTSKEEGLGLDVARLYVTVFEGNADAPRDQESFSIWKNLGVSEKRIYFMPAKSNWWSAGDNGPCGPDSEMFYDITENGLGDMTKEEYLKADETQKVVEIWNDVFMEYLKKDGKVQGKLPQQNVDTGAGLERMSMVLQQKDNVFDTDLFRPIMDKIDEFSASSDIRSKRIIADHVRTSVFMIGDGVIPSNTDRGYILRRLLRRAVRFGDVVGMKKSSLFWLADAVIDIYKEIYPELVNQRETIKVEIDKEEQKFRGTLAHGIKELGRIIENSKTQSEKTISGHEAFKLFSSYGFPIEMTEELAREKGFHLNRQEFEKEMSEHIELSRKGAEKKFKGGLASTGVQETRYHTATHLLNAALRAILGEHIFQKGSNITAERLRFDFSHSEKMTPEQIAKVEEWVNDKIKQAIPVTFSEMPKEEAKKLGAIGVFNDKYGEVVKVYQISATPDEVISRELCGGPHVSNTSELGTFKIQKEEAVSQGVRRIKAVLL
ncbi:MAG: alanine--tRNA ligase [Candidatus Pacebacteria bacterium]|nr:alanine--tRNA ligase [Candidatus Paceibacterota bacterium]